MRRVYTRVSLVAVVIAFGLDWLFTDDCTPDPPQLAFDKTRYAASIAWAATLAGVGGVIWVSVRHLASRVPSFGGLLGS